MRMQQSALLVQAQPHGCMSWQRMKPECKGERLVLFKAAITFSIGSHTAFFGANSLQYQSHHCYTPWNLQSRGPTIGCKDAKLIFAFIFSSYIFAALQTIIVQLHSSQISSALIDRETKTHSRGPNPILLLPLGTQDELLSQDNFS